MNLSSIWKDPPPVLAFELSESGIAVARTGSKPELEFCPLKSGVISVSPLRDNVLEPDELARAVRATTPPSPGKKRRDVAIVLPDNCARVSVLDFDDFPSDPKERMSLVRFRIRKSIPFDVESAAVSYWPQPAGGKKFEVAVVVTPLEIVARYEAPFRAAGLNPGLVTISALSALHLVEDGTVTVLAKLSGRFLTVLVLEKGLLRLVRCLELSQNAIPEMAAELYPTFVYVEDNLGVKAEKLLLCGFGTATAQAAQEFRRELEVEVDALRSPLGMPDENNAGLLGYLRSVSQ